MIVSIDLPSWAPLLAALTPDSPSEWSAAIIAAAAIALLAAALWLTRRPAETLQQRQERAQGGAR